MVPGYNHLNFCPVNPGEILDNRYKALAKVGWGSSSRSYCVHGGILSLPYSFNDKHRKRQASHYVILKVNNCDFSDKESVQCELVTSRHLAAANPSHNGFPLVRTIVDSLEVTGPYGNHIYLVFEPMRESLRLFRRHFTDSRLPLPLLKGYLQMFLMALDYIHSECQTIHTGEFILS